MRFRDNIKNLKECRHPLDQVFKFCNKKTKNLNSSRFYKKMIGLEWDRCCSRNKSLMVQQRFIPHSHEQSC
jgi:hypothetical protein